MHLHVAGPRIDMTDASKDHVRCCWSGRRARRGRDRGGDRSRSVRLARPGVQLTYRCTGAGPTEIRTAHDARAAAPFVVKTIIDAAREGFDAVIVDCTADPGVVEARAVVDIPVVGAGEALRSAIAIAKQPVCELTGDDLRGMDVAEFVSSLRGARDRRARRHGFLAIRRHPRRGQPELVVSTRSRSPSTPAWPSVDKTCSATIVGFAAGIVETRCV